jgi:transcriptional regulator with XRE-family HTH domain
MVIRLVRIARGWRLADLAARCRYSSAQISRYERGITQLGVEGRRRFANVLEIPPQWLGISTPRAGHPGHQAALSPSVAGDHPDENGDDPVRRRQLLISLAGAGAALAAGTGAATAGPPGALLITRVRDAMLGLGFVPSDCSPKRIRAGLDTAIADFHACRYQRLAEALPRLITAGHQAADSDGTAAAHTVLAEVYTLVTRMMIKLDDQQLGWLAADRARTHADTAAAPFVSAEAARNLAVLARKTGWHSQAMAIALNAADRSELRTGTSQHAAQRGLLIQSAAYSAAKAGDRATMRELTDEAASIAARLGDTPLLRDHGGGFSPATVELHRISAEYSVGEPGAALTAAHRIAPAALPTVERRARYFTDIAQAHGQYGHRTQALNALLAAERQAPEEVHSRPAVHTLITHLTTSGPTTPDLRKLAKRCGLT